MNDSPYPDAAELVERIWERDPTVWTGNEEAHWLGWLDEPLRMRERVAELSEFAGSVAADVDDVVLLGMGGSSLAPEVIARAFAARRFTVLDTTHPAAIRRLAERLDYDRTLFVVSSKSGTTLETRSHFDFFWEKGGKRGDRFVAVTDPGSPLEDLAGERGSRAFAGEPSIGGRYSALSAFGLVPAALMGIDLDRLLDRAEATLNACRVADGNPGLVLGLALGRGWEQGRDKVLIRQNPHGFGLWVEQLLAESTGKEGRGLVPAPDETGAGPDRQLHDVLIDDPYDLGAEFFRWEFATAVAGAILGINPFDQPNVQEAKDRTSQILSAGQDLADKPESSVEALLAQVRQGDYVCDPGLRRPRRRGAAAAALSSGSVRRRTVSSRSGWARATCTRPASCTRAARRSAASSRSSTNPARNSLSPARSSVSAGSSGPRLRATTTR